MSYARFSVHSDVYVLAHVGGFVQCCGCQLLYDFDSANLHSPAEVVAHMREHVTAGHQVSPELLEEATFGPEDFVAMCDIFLCRKDAGHSGPHTPIRSTWGDVARMEAIRARQIAGEEQQNG